VNTLPQDELADIIYQYGEEKASRKIAAAIVAAREIAPIETTKQLADIVRSVVRKTDKTDPATRTFQALRICVNDELGEIERALAASPHLLRPGGRLIAVTFHSLEDRIVKRFLRPQIQTASRHDPLLMLQPEQEASNAHFALSQTKPIHPAEDEIGVNPRARSAKLRIAIRNEVPMQHGEKMP
jgi:16S rRNA (cytosine1402-N4)-methyltransferase